MAVLCEYKLCEQCARLLARERENQRQELIQLDIKLEGERDVVRTLRREIEVLCKKLSKVQQAVNC